MAEENKKGRKTLRLKSKSTEKPETKTGADKAANNKAESTAADSQKQPKKVRAVPKTTPDLFVDDDKTAPAKPSTANKKRKTKPKSPTSTAKADNAKTTSDKSENTSSKEKPKRKKQNGTTSTKQSSLKDHPESTEKADESNDKGESAGNSADLTPPPISILPAPGSGPLPRKAPKEDKSKWLYIAFLLGGFFTILLGKTIFDLPSLFVSITAAVTIVIYGGIAWYNNRFTAIRMDRIGDNCYYLGLTYTLASLMAALLQLGDTRVGSQLLENFGIALLSTAVGIIMRLVLMQFRTEMDDTETAARLRLTEAYEDFRQQLFSVKADMENYNTFVFDNLRHTQAEFSKSFVMQGESIAKKVKSTDELLGVFEERFSTLETYTAQLGQAAKSLAERMNEIHARPDAIEAAFDRLSEGLDKTSDAIGTSVISLQQKSEKSADFEMTADRLGKRLTEIDELVKTLRDNISVQTETVVKSVQSLKTHTDALKSYTVDAEEEGKKMRAATEDVYGALGNLAGVIIKGVKGG